MHDAPTPIRRRRLASLVTAGLLSAALIGGAGLDTGARAASSVTPQPAPAELLSLVPSPFDLKAAQPANTYIGELQGNPSILGLVIKGNKALLYWCDGKAPGDWFGGTVSGNTITGASAKGITVRLTKSGATWKGTLTRGGKRFAVTATAPTGEVGIFRHTAEPLVKKGSVLGWLVTAQNLAGSTTNADGTTSNAVPFGSCNGLDCGRKIGGGCLKRRLALRLTVNSGSATSIDTIIDIQDAGAAAGCDMSGITS